MRNLDEILEYAPTTDKWSLIGRLPFVNRSAFGVPDGNGLLMLGGYTDTFESEILRYDLSTNEVQPAGRLPVGLAGGRFVQIGSKILGGTGENGIKMRFHGTLESALETS